MSAASTAPSTGEGNEAIVVTPHDRRRALWGSGVGATIEWYDYFLYGTMSGIVFGPLFFPNEDPVVSQLSALASFALAFLIRPIGGVIFAHIGDRIGRKRTLVITLTTMGVSTGLMGVLPTYEMVGVWAPILLMTLRLVQGLALGGEWGGGMLLAVEYAPAKRRGFYGAVPELGAFAGLALGNIVTIIVDGIFTGDVFLSIGWRMPFLFSLVLLLVGLWIRNKIEETPSFRKVLQLNQTKRVPLLYTLRHHWNYVLIAAGMKTVQTASFFIFATFSISYLTSQQGMDQSDVLAALLIGSVLAIGSMFAYGAFSDRIGRKRAFILGSVLTAVFMFPYIWLLGQGTLPSMYAAVIISLAVISPSVSSLVGTLSTESFPSSVRYTGSSLGYQIGAALAGGPAPLIATWLMTQFGGSMIPIALFICLMAVIAITAVSFTQEKSGVPLDAN